MTRLKRFAALLTAILLTAAVLTSCDWVDKIKFHLTPATEAPRGIPEDNDREYVSTAGNGYTYSPYYTPIHPRHSYQCLSGGQKKLYDALYDNVREVYPDTDADEELYKTKQVIIDGVLLSTADIRVAAKALYDDNPDIFWLSSTIYQLTSADNSYTAVQMRSVYSPEEIKAMQNAVRQAVNNFYAEVPEGLSAYEREKYVHDFVGRICEYDSEAAETHASADRITEAYIVYGTLVKGMAVCEGYARTMQLLLCGLGVDCVGVTGLGFDSDGTDELHMWDAVSLDDGWYYTDPTWDDQLYDYRRYQYFNLDEATMGADHQASRLLSELTEDDINGNETYSSVAMNIFLPECTATHYQYYRFECPHLTNYAGEDVKDALYRAALNREEYLTVYIDPDMLEFDGAVNDLFRDYPQYFFSYIRDVNGWLSGYEIDNSNLNYYSNPERYTVTVMLNYY